MTLVGLASLHSFSVVEAGQLQKACNAEKRKGCMAAKSAFRSDANIRQKKKQGGARSFASFQKCLLVRLGVQRLLVENR